MLVLARREGETLVFPELGITLELLGIKGSAARLGIQAPPEVTVLRGELVGPAAPSAAAAPAASLPANSRELLHALRNRINALNLAIHLLERQVALGITEAAQKTYRRIVRELQALQRHVVVVPRVEMPPLPTGDKRRALLVEDDANECELLAGILRIQGFLVNTAGDGADALDYLASHERPDIVLLDMIMPRCDGPATIRAIRGNPALEDLKVFALSGTAPATWGLPSGRQGVDRWFQKPIDPAVLIREIAQALAEQPCRAG